MTIIRPATSKDIPDVVVLLTELGYHSAITQEFKNTWEEIISSSRSGILIAESSGCVSGYVAYSFKAQLRIAGYSLEIDELSIKPSFRGTGVGSKLIAHIVQFAREHHIKRIILSTNRERESYQRKFYEKNGFKEKNSAWMVINL